MKKPTKKHKTMSDLKPKATHKVKGGGIHAYGVRSYQQTTTTPSQPSAPIQLQ